MKTSIILSVAGFIAMPAWAADLADEVKSAVQQLADKPNYSWTTKVDPPPGQGGRGAGAGAGARRNGQQQGDQATDQQGGRGRGGGRGGFGGGGFGGGSPPAGKTEKGGFTVLTFRTGENTQEAVVKGDKVAVKEEDEWKTSAELAEGDGGGGGQGGFNRARFLARRAQQFKSPATDAQEVLGRVKELKKEGETYTGELTADAIKQMFTFRGRGGQQGGGGGGGGNFPPPDTSGLKGTAKFWVKDGVLSKYETHVEGKMVFGRDNREMEMNRTTTVEVKDVGSTKVDVPAEAKKKLRA
jgi:hypothetical protein